MTDEIITSDEAEITEIKLKDLKKKTAAELLRMAEDLEVDERENLV